MSFVMLCTVLNEHLWWWWHQKACLGPQHKLEAPRPCHFLKLKTSSMFLWFLLLFQQFQLPENRCDCIYWMAFRMVTGYSNVLVFIHTKLMYDLWLRVKLLSMNGHRPRGLPKDKPRGLWHGALWLHVGFDLGFVFRRVLGFDLGFPCLVY